MKSLQNFFFGNENCINATVAFLNCLKVNVTLATITHDLTNHPEYPSLLSITDLLTSYGVDNITVKVDSQRFIEIPPPFLTQIKSVKETGTSFTIVKKIDTGTITFYHPEKNKWVSEVIETFLEKTDGIALLAEIAATSGEKDYYKKKKEEKTTTRIKNLSLLFLPISLLISCLIYQIQTGFSSWLPSLFSVLALIGSVVGILLLFYEIDQHNPRLQKICTSGKKTNCAAILKSNAAKIFGVQWSIIGFSYFTGILISFLIHGMNDRKYLIVISWLSLSASTYIFYSIYYQWKVARQWCPLCISAQTILLLQCIIPILGGWHKSIPLNSDTILILVQMLTAVIIPFIVANFAFSYIRKVKEAENKIRELLKIKHNFPVFEALLSKQKKVLENPDGLGIKLGNPHAEHKIIKVCNPYCMPCAFAHKPIEKLLNNNNVEIQLIFTASNDEGDVKAPLVKHLLAIAEENDQKIIMQSLDDWYNSDEKNYEKFALKYPLNGELKLQFDKIAAMHKWCNNTGITHTPTIFLNSFQLPDMYSISDLDYFLNDPKK